MSYNPSFPFSTYTKFKEAVAFDPKFEHLPFAGQLALWVSQQEEKPSHMLLQWLEELQPLSDAEAKARFLDAIDYRRG